MNSYFSFMLSLIYVSSMFYLADVLLHFQNIHSATKDFEAAQRAEREAFIQASFIYQKFQLL